MDPYLCLDAAPNLFGLLDTTIAPTLLYYSYLPIVFLSLFFSFFLYTKNHALQTRALLAIAVIFSLWIFNELLQWIAVDSWLVHFGWQLSALFQVGLVFSVAYFVYVFLNNRRPPFSYLLMGFLLISPVLFLLPTKFNMEAFDLIECQSTFGVNLWSYVYILQVVVAVFSLILCIRKRRESKDIQIKKLSLYLGMGTLVLLGLFVATNITGDATLVYEFNLIGPLGMALFIAFLSYMVVRFKAFNVKIFGAQILVSTLIFLVFAILFIRKIENVRIVTIFTLILTAVLGTFLIRSVRREVESRELIQTQRGQLEKANARLKELDTQKTEFISFATHQLRTPLTAIRGTASLILEGDMGPVSDTIKEAVQTITASIKTQLNIVEDYLNVSRIELGTMKYDLIDMDFKDLLKEVVEEQKSNIDAKGLSYSLSIDESQSYRIKADPDKFKQVVLNAIDNSVKYTPQGSLSFELVKDTARKVVRLKISDTGVGIRPDVLPKLFQKFMRAPKASEANIHGTGLGLFIAKEIMNAHGGKIWAESEGEGKGSQFYIEVPVIL